jgi:hypothetical protein
MGSPIRPVALLSLFFPLCVRAQSTPAASGPEMERLAKALAGEWETVETMEKGPEFPQGGSRRGVVHARLAAEGTTFLYEVDSDGSAGRLNGFLAIWWDAEAKLYDVFVCFNSPKHPCRMRGTARWEGDTFVNDYELPAGGKATRWRDTFRFTPTSHTLLAAMDTGGGQMKTLITTDAKRR